MLAKNYAFMTHFSRTYKIKNVRSNASRLYIDNCDKSHSLVALEPGR